VVALTSYAAMVLTAIAQGMDIIFSGAGLPLDLPGFLKSGSKNKPVPIHIHTNIRMGTSLRLIEFNFANDGPK
jgi:phosphoribosylcarboxyaminoimidazole (NCAIR) mutase